MQKKAAEVFQRMWRVGELYLRFRSSVRGQLLRLRGARIGRGTNVPKVFYTWPHQIQLGRKCVLQPHIFFNFDHYWVPGPNIIIGDGVFIGMGVEFNVQGRVEVGDRCLIGAGSRFIDHDHGMTVGQWIGDQPGVVSPIALADDVWVGANVVVLKGVTVGAGAVLAAGAVVTKSVPAGEIWAGVPARKVGGRE